MDSSGLSLTGPHPYVGDSRSGFSTPGGCLIEMEQEGENNLPRTAGHASWRLPGLVGNKINELLNELSVDR